MKEGQGETEASLVAGSTSGLLVGSFPPFASYNQQVVWRLLKLCTHRGAMFVCGSVEA